MLYKNEYVLIPSASTPLGTKRNIQGYRILEEYTIMLKSSNPLKNATFASISTIRTAHFWKAKVEELSALTAMAQDKIRPANRENRTQPCATIADNAVVAVLTQAQEASAHFCCRWYDHVRASAKTAGFAYKRVLFKVSRRYVDDVAIIMTFIQSSFRHWLPGLLLPPEYFCLSDGFDFGWNVLEFRFQFSFETYGVNSVLFEAVSLPVFDFDFGWNGFVLKQFRLLLGRGSDDNCIVPPWHFTLPSIVSPSTGMVSLTYSQLTHVVPPLLCESQVWV